MRLGLPPGPWLTGAVERRARWWLVTLIWLATGVVLGLSQAWPPLAPAAWLAVALTAYALCVQRTRVGAVAGPCLAHVTSFYFAFDWGWEMNDVLFDFTLPEAIGFSLAQAFAWSLPFVFTIGSGQLLFRGRLAPCFWLPLAWGMAEVVRFEVMRVNIGDWLATQWQTAPVMRALGVFGWWPTLVGCLFAAASLGQAVATRRARIAAPALAVAAGLLLLPPLPSGDLELLRGVAAVHTHSTLALPHRAPAGELELVVWPEAAFELRPRMGEGPASGVRLHRLMPDSAAEHLVGLHTTFPYRLPQNQLVSVRADGTVVTSRAKKMLMPFAERPAFGFGEHHYTEGRAPALLHVGGRAIIPLICGEYLSRALITEGLRAGGELLVVSARDQMMVTGRSRRQLLAVQVLRSVEFGIPSVRASYGGAASFIAPDGRVLAESGVERNGLLRWDATHGMRDTDFMGHAITPGLAPPPPQPTVAVVYSRHGQELRTRCPEGRCTWHVIEDFTCPAEPVETVVIAGHATHERWLGQPADAIARAAACFRPSLVVVDTCLSAASPLLEALSALDATIVAAPALLPPEGLAYGPAFFEPGPVAARVAAIADPPGGTLLRWRADRAELAAAVAAAAAMDTAALTERLVSWSPPVARVPLGAVGEVRVAVPRDRLDGIVRRERPRRRLRR